MCIRDRVIGGHGDTTMIPLARLATYKGQPVSTLLSAEKLDEVVASTMVGGAHTDDTVLGDTQRFQRQISHSVHRRCV